MNVCTIPIGTMNVLGVCGKTSKYIVLEYSSKDKYIVLEYKDK